MPCPTFWFTSGPCCLPWPPWVAPVGPLEPVDRVLCEAPCLRSSAGQSDKQSRGVHPCPPGCTLRRAPIPPPHPSPPRRSIGRVTHPLSKTAPNWLNRPGDRCGRRMAKRGVVAPVLMPRRLGRLDVGEGQVKHRVTPHPALNQARQDAPTARRNPSSAVELALSEANSVHSLCWAALKHCEKYNVNFSKFCRIDVKLYML